MIAIVSEGRIDYGPAAWSANDIQRAMFRYGYTLQSGVFTAPGDEPAPFPAEEPQGPVGFSGCDMLPVVEVDEPAPEGKVFAGREPVILEDRVEMRPVWADAPVLSGTSSRVEFTTLDFLYLFTPSEQVALKAAEASNPAVGVFWEAWRSAKSIRTDDQRTIAAVDMLASEGIGIITKDRANEILGRKPEVA